MLKIRLAPLATIGVLLAAPFLAGPAARAADRVVLPSDVTPVRYDIAIVPDAAHLAFSGTVTIAIDVHRPTSTIALNAADLSLQSVSVSGEPATPRISDRKSTRLNSSH